MTERIAKSNDTDVRSAEAWDGLIFVGKYPFRAGRPVPTAEAGVVGEDMRRVVMMSAEAWQALCEEIPELGARKFRPPAVAAAAMLKERR